MENGIIRGFLIELNDEDSDNEMVSRLFYLFSWMRVF